MLAEWIALEYQQAVKFLMCCESPKLATRFHRFHLRAVFETHYEFHLNTQSILRQSHVRGGQQVIHGRLEELRQSRMRRVPQSEGHR